MTGSRWHEARAEVTGKVGSVEVRDYSIRKPTLKVGGGERQNNFVDTYSIA